MDELIDHYQKNPIFDQNAEKLYLIRPFESANSIVTSLKAKLNINNN